MSLRDKGTYITDTCEIMICHLCYREFLRNVTVFDCNAARAAR